MTEDVAFCLINLFYSKGISDENMQLFVILNNCIKSNNIDDYSQKINRLHHIKIFLYDFIQLQNAKKNAR
jgi:hypothetical protein